MAIEIVIVVLLVVFDKIIVAVVRAFCLLCVHEASKASCNYSISSNCVSVIVILLDYTSSGIAIVTAILKSRTGFCLRRVQKAGRANKSKTYVHQRSLVP